MTKVSTLLTFVNRLAVVRRANDLEDTIYAVSEGTVSFDDPAFNYLVGIDVTQIAKQVDTKGAFLDAVAKEEPVTLRLSKNVELIEYIKNKS